MQKATGYDCGGEPGDTLADGKLVEKARSLYTSDEARKGSVARAGSVLQFNYKAVEGARVALGAYRGCLRVRRKPGGKGGGGEGEGREGG